MAAAIGIGAAGSAARADEVDRVMVCGVQGNLYNRTLEQKYSGDLVFFTGTADMFKAFTENRCDAIAYDGPVLQQKVGEDG